MAGRRKNLTLDEKLEKITIEIETMENSLATLKQTKLELEEQIRQNRLLELDKLISDNGMSIDEIKEIIESYKMTV